MLADTEQKSATQDQLRRVIRYVSIEVAIAIPGSLALARALSGEAGIGGAPNPNLILYPPFAMFLLVVLVLSRMGWLRFGSVLRGTMSMRFYSTFDEGEEPGPMRVVTRNFINLFEVPMLFYVGVLMAYASHQVSDWMVALAWTYVALRYAHSYVHVTSNDVPLRFSFYATSGLVLVAMWTTLLVALLAA